MIKNDAEVHATGGQSFFSHKSVAPSASVQLIKVYTDYNRNEVKADEEYNGKLLVFDGVASSVKKDMFGSIYVDLSTMAVAYMDDSEVAYIRDVVPGQHVALECVGAGAVMSQPVFRNCQQPGGRLKKMTAAENAQIDAWFAGRGAPAFAVAAPNGVAFLFDVYWVGASLKASDPCVQTITQGCDRALRNIKALRDTSAYQAAYQSERQILRLP